MQLRAEHAWGRLRRHGPEPQGIDEVGERDAAESKPEPVQHGAARQTSGW